ncbi:unnamed protein product [Gongylonema pulchrum]|uniref:Pyridine nucleotide-disulfide oxidoreductase domain-containing protein 1 n=1 Tax=Gongylonema pulchrum TaxID=637853 RepID=A0A3P7Q305_9BILA|nr:unnamed protein product [Gongylonema pulchrum]
MILVGFIQFFFFQIGQLTEAFDIAEQPELLLDKKQKFAYDKLCIATGGAPKVSCKHPLVISIRDTETVDRLRSGIKDAKRVLVIGNGGIATEIVLFQSSHISAKVAIFYRYELKNVEIIWAIRHSSISATFFDEGAAEFFKPMLLHGHSQPQPSNKTASKRYQITVDSDKETGITGCALGPEWASAADISGALNDRQVHVIYGVEMKRLLPPEEASCHCISGSEPGIDSSSNNWPLYVELSNEQVIGCDLLIEATGVHPNSDLWARDCPVLKLAQDDGIIVNDHMMTSVPDVYACGDVCTAGWPWAKHWIQVIFLGRFNGEGVEKPWRILMRITKDLEYVKLILTDGRIQGAVLVGETDLEEVIENLILNQIDVSQVEEGLLDPDIEIADYFD